MTISMILTPTHSFHKMIIHYPDVFLSSASTCIQLLALRSAANAALKLTRSTEAEAAALVPPCWKIQACLK